MPLGKCGIEAAEDDRDLVVGGHEVGDVHFVHQEHVLGAQHVRAIEPDVGERGQSVEAELHPVRGSRTRRRRNSTPVPPVAGVVRLVSVESLGADRFCDRARYHDIVPFADIR